MAVMKAPAASNPGLLADFDHAGRAGDVDFGEVGADHIEADQHQAAFDQDRPECFGNFPIPWRKILRYAGAAAARLPRVSPALGMRARQKGTGWPAISRCVCRRR
jgi:hypothetical protein